MVDVEKFVTYLQDNKISFYAGVPDSLLKSFCAYIADNIDLENHVAAANEGNALAVATGHYLGTGQVPLVYMQNSGLGNIVNPLTSLTSADVYAIPVLLLIGWRGEPDKRDEPQHKQMGRIQNDLLESLEVPYEIIGPNDDIYSSVDNAMKHFDAESSPYAIVLRRDIFAKYSPKSHDQDEPGVDMTKEKALHLVIDNLADEKIISTTGKLSRELFELRETLGQTHENDFLCVGNMGHTSSVALGLAIAQNKRKIFCFDGDGSFIMHMGAASVIGQISPDNYVHIVFNNFSYDSVGGQSTAARTSNFPDIAKACGYKHAMSVKTEADLISAVKDSLKKKGPILIDVQCRKGSRKDLGRPTTSPRSNKVNFMNSINTHLEKNS